MPNVVEFGFDVFRVDDSYRSLLQAHAAKLKRDPSRRLLVLGHVDSQGPREYNRALAKKRAEMVAKALRSMGVPGAQIELDTAGDEAAAGAPQAAAESGRRVELIYR